MCKTQTEIAKQLKDTPTKVKLNFGFIRTSKTRLSEAYQKFIAPKNEYGFCLKEAKNG